MISLLATLVSKAKLPLSRYKVNSSSMYICNHSSEYLVSYMCINYVEHSGLHYLYFEFLLKGPFFLQLQLIKCNLTWNKKDLISKSCFYMICFAYFIQNVSKGGMVSTVVCSVKDTVEAVPPVITLLVCVREVVLMDGQDLCVKKAFMETNYFNANLMHKHSLP